ncbi:MAG: queuine tRNA-ribosyltransferase family protein, partial [Rickettsiales bacterium]|nr:queuine tRNA-ribosyltransferase family protein [Rickettsiales bacterium]
HSNINCNRSIIIYNPRMSLKFNLMCNDGNARRGSVETAHGTFQTPAYYDWRTKKIAMYDFRMDPKFKSL